MSAFSAAASDEDGDTISALREKLGRAHALCRIRLDRIRELEAMLRGAGAGGVGKSEQPQVEQEPVAWIEVKPNPFDASCRGVASVFDHKLPPGDYALYATPNRMLSDKELNLIASAWHLHLLDGKDKKDVFDFARAIERAHGIGGEA